MMWILDIFKKVLINILTFIIVGGLIWYFVLRHIFPF